MAGETTASQQEWGYRMGCLASINVLLDWLKRNAVSRADWPEMFELMQQSLSDLANELCERDKVYLDGRSGFVDEAIDRVKNAPKTGDGGRMLRASTWSPAAWASSLHCLARTTLRNEIGGSGCRFSSTRNFGLLSEPQSTQAELYALRCPHCHQAVDAKGRCWQCCERLCHCGRGTGSAFIALCFLCQHQELVRSQK